MSLNYKQIQDLVLADGFVETDRAAAKNWINTRHAWLWDSDEYTFRMDSAFVAFVVGSQVVGSMPPDFRIATSLYDANGARLKPIADINRFYDLYNINLAPTGSPEAFTVVGANILVGPMGDGTTGMLAYERSRTPLVEDDDVTAPMPDGYDLALVAGAKALGYKLKYPGAAVLYQPYEDEFAASVAALQRNYLTGVRGDVGQFGAYRPGQPVY